MTYLPDLLSVLPVACAVRGGVLSGSVLGVGFVGAVYLVRSVWPWNGEL